MSNTSCIRNIAIIAHVDHGKTTLVDALFSQSGIYRLNQAVVERAMDSIDQERERGITIMAKVTAVSYEDLLIQIVDTPGHADFGGEVERSLQMVDGVLLLVDAAEGPLPQTRFVLKKALEKNLPYIIVINKIDRSDARIEEVVDEIYDLFIDLGAHEDQLDFPIVYTNAKLGTATVSLDDPGTDLNPLVETIKNCIPAPEDKQAQPFCMQVNQLAYDEYVGRLVIGRIQSGSVVANQMVDIISEGKKSSAKVSTLFKFYGLKRESIDKANCGDIIAISGLQDVSIGDTIGAVDKTKALPVIRVDEPTVSMVFQINDGPLAGQSKAKFLTSRQLRSRLMRESFANVSIKVEDGESADSFVVMGRGELQLSVLIETLRRESYELCVRNPQVVTRPGDDGIEEPTERLVCDVPQEYLGAASEIIGRRRATLLDQRYEGQRVRLEYLIPTRGLFGLRSQILTATRGTAIFYHVFETWTPWSGPIKQRASGALVSDRKGIATPYALFHLQPRGVLFIKPGTQVYEGMVIGEHSRDNDLNVNVCREKKLTNIRAAGKDENTVISAPRKMSLEQVLEWIKDGEMVEVTPVDIRLRKQTLSASRRQVIDRQKKNELED